MAHLVICAPSPCKKPLSPSCTVQMSDTKDSPMPVPLLAAALGANIRTVMLAYGNHLQPVIEKVVSTHEATEIFPSRIRPLWVFVSTVPWICLLQPFQTPVSVNSVFFLFSVINNSIASQCSSFCTSCFCIDFVQFSMTRIQVLSSVMLMYYNWPGTFRALIVVLLTLLITVDQTVNLHHTLFLRFCAGD